MSSAFDDALTAVDLYNAATAYALDCGIPGTTEYRAAWLKFRGHIKTTEDLQELYAHRLARQAERRARQRTQAAR